MSCEILVVRGRLISTNTLINTARTNRFLAAKQKHDQMDIVTAEILSDKEFRNNRYQGKVVVYIDFYEKDLKRDYDGVVGSGCKIILDALVENKIIPDDSRRFVTKVPCEVFVDKVNPRIEIRLVEEI